MQTEYFITLLGGYHSFSMLFGKPILGLEGAMDITYASAMLVFFKHENLNLSPEGTPR